MIARLHPALSSCEGLTALETAVVLFITAIVVVPLLAVAGRVVTLPVEWQANVEAARDAREILRQVADDARQASCIEAGVSSISDTEDNKGTSSEYWRFTWVDHTDSRSFEVNYYYRENGPVVREETIRQIEENVAAEPCELPEDHPIPGEGEPIGSVEYFEIYVTPISNGGALKCLIVAVVRPSSPRDAFTQKIAAMMRPDDANCEQLPE